MLTNKRIKRAAFVLHALRILILVDSAPCELSKQLEKWSELLWCQKNAAYCYPNGFEFVQAKQGT